MYLLVKGWERNKKPKSSTWTIDLRNKTPALWPFNAGVLILLTREILVKLHFHQTSGAVAHKAKNSHLDIYLSSLKEKEKLFPRLGDWITIGRIGSGVQGAKFSGTSHPGLLRGWERNRKNKINLNDCFKKKPIKKHPHYGYLMRVFWFYWPKRFWSNSIFIKQVPRVASN